MMNRFIIGAIAVAVILSAGFAFSMIYLVEDDEESQISSIQEDYVEDYIVGDKEQLYEMHDVIVDATVTSFSNETGTPLVTMQVHEYFKNPQDKSQLLVKGEFGLTGDFCAIPGNCTRILAYLNQGENGNLSSGETWAWLTKECNASCVLQE